jgi:D-alanyl-D-alanine carboxypeptidase
MRKRVISFLLAFTVLLVFQAVPVYAAADDNSPQTVCTADILIDADSGQVLYEKNQDRLLQPASLTKMMTCLLAIEHYKGDLDQKITVPKQAVGIGGNSLDLKEGEVFTVRQLLYGMMLHSCNDVAVCFAVNISGSVSAFSQEMNARAREVGAVHTNFINPNGLTESSSHITTARDIALIAQECMRNATFRKIVKTAKYTIPATNMSKERKVKSTDQLLVGTKFSVTVNGTKRYAKYKYATGVKTGLMPTAGYCFCGAATKGDMDLIAVAMKGSADQDRFADVISMFDYGFDNYHTVQLLAKGDSAGHVWIKNGHYTRVAAVAENGAYVTLTSNEADDLATSRVVLKKGLKAPLKAGTVVGTVKLYEDGAKVGSADLVLAKTVTEGGPWSAVYISDPAFVGGLIILITVLILITVIGHHRRRRKKQREERRRREKEKRAMEIARERAAQQKRNNNRDWPF